MNNTFYLCGIHEGVRLSNIYISSRSTRNNANILQEGKKLTGYSENIYDQCQSITFNNNKIDEIINAFTIKQNEYLNNISNCISANKDTNNKLNMCDQQLTIYFYSCIILVLTFICIIIIYIFKHYEIQLNIRKKE